MAEERSPGPNWRARGGVLVAVGLFLVLLMAAIAWNLAPSLLRPGEAIDGTTFTGTAEQGELYLGLFALVGLIGALAVAAGIHMIATGRRHAAAVRIASFLLVLFVAVAWAARRGLL